MEDGDEAVAKTVEITVADTQNKPDVANTQAQQMYDRRGADIILDDRVWLAEDVYVYKGVTIGKNTVVAARSTVLKSLPEHCVAAGTPARVVKTGTTWNRSLNPSKWT